MTGTDWLRWHARKRWLAKVERDGVLPSGASKELDKARHAATVARLRAELDEVAGNAPALRTGPPTKRG